MNKSDFTDAPIPRLSAICEDPSLISRLDWPVASAFGAAFTGLATSCAFRAAAAKPKGRWGRALTTAQAAELLGVSAAVLTRRMKRPPFSAFRINLPGIRRVMFSEARLLKYLKAQKGRA